MQGKPFVLYFYPKADTPGCTKEAQAFQEALPELAAIGVDVIGVSKDAMKPIEKFAEKYGLDLPARLRPGRQGGRGVWRLGREIDVRQELHGHRPQHGAGRRGRPVARIWRKVKVPGHAAEVMQAAEARWPAERHIKLATP